MSNTNTSPSNFLQSLAENCHQQYGRDCDQLTIIFPNKRAGVYFAKYLADLYDQPVWSPNIYSLEEYVQLHQSKTLAGELPLSLILYNCYKQLIKETESFDSFLPWGEMILKDFNDIDNYMVEPDHIFKVVKSQKELEDSFFFLSEEDQKTIQKFWRGFLPEPNKKQGEFVKTWAILKDLYHRFNEALDHKNVTYKGKMLRDYAPTDAEVNGATWFAGFNALTRTEEKIIKQFLTNAGNDIYWDIDAYYFNNEIQEAGVFFREYAKDKVFEKSIKRDLKNTLNRANREINVVAAPFSMGQIMAATQTLSVHINEGFDPHDTLIVLTDESKLDHLIKNLPESIDSVNVTMGWPLSKSRAYQLLLQLTELRNRLGNVNQKGIYFKELERLYEFTDLLEVEQTAFDRFKKEALLTNKLYYSNSEVIALFPKINAFEQKEADVSGLIDQLLLFLKSINLDALNELDRSVVVLLHQTLKQVHMAISENQIALQTSSFIKLLKKLGQSIKMPLSGDPLQGIQVMGILETRNLTFKNVMIIGMNEDAWPKSSSNSSFIPYNIRCAFDLPVTEHQDAMQSYLFYRLVQSADNIWMSYNNVTEFNNNGELSRYVQQLKLESDITFNESAVINQVEAETEKAIIIKKDEAVLAKMDEFLVGKTPKTSRLSPSALNAYIECKLRFYFKYVEKIYEPDVLIEDMDPSLLGNLLHGGMENLYKDQKVLDAEILKQLRSNIDIALSGSFDQQKMPVNEVKIGRQLVVYEVVRKFMEAIVDFDIQHAPFEILGLESKEYDLDWPIETAIDTVKVALKGIIDRIDRIDDVVRIVDYKSGRDERTFGEIDLLLDATSNKRNKAVFQLLYYCLLFKENSLGITNRIQPSMFNSKDLFSENFNLKITQTKLAGEILDFVQLEDEFKSILTLLLTEIYNPMVDFTQTDDFKKCEYCPYIDICKRG